ncbi:MAG: hypothetical protein IJ027_00960 [Oscillospiraceae bacterium]|nr:hypothetical protein [Oscillospiraceae bacterium]
MAILKKLYNGHINVVEKAIKKGSEYDRLNELSSEIEDRLIETISKQEKQLYEKIIELRFNQEDILLEETFTEGVRIGALIMLEVLSEPKSQFEPIYKSES